MKSDEPLQQLLNMNLVKEYDKIRSELYSLIYTELFKLTMVLKIWNDEKIQLKITELIHNSYDTLLPFELEYLENDEHGYSGLWNIHIGEKKLFKKRLCFNFDLFDKKIKCHKKKVAIKNRNHKIDIILN